jgi:hypothetical protein
MPKKGASVMHAPNTCGQLRGIAGWSRNLDPQLGVVLLEPCFPGARHIDGAGHN